MRTTFIASAILAAVLTVGGARAGAQDQPHTSQLQWSSSDLAATFTTDRAKVAPSSNDNFWLRGAGIDAAVTFYRGFGLAMNLTGEHASKIAPGVNLSTLAVFAGPRYTRRLGGKHESRVYLEALAGGVRGFDSVFPKSTGLTDRASSFSYQVGGGWDIAISKHFAIRAIEANYVRSYLPNNGTDTQGQIRLAFGVVYHMPKD